jgi:TonB family protein
METDSPNESSTPPARKEFSWPPTGDDLDAIHVIPFNPHAKRAASRFDPARIGLALVSILTIGVALSQLLPGQSQDWDALDQDPTVAAASAPASLPQATAFIEPTLLAEALPAFAPIAVAPIASAPATSTADATVTAPKTTRRFTTSRAAVVRSARATRVSAPRVIRASIRSSDRDSSDRDGDVSRISPPLRLPESYVQPRVVSASNRMRGKVVLAVLVRPNGRVGRVDVLSRGDRDNDRALEHAAVTAVKQWRYRPALRDGVPTPARVKVVVNFS